MKKLSPHIGVWEGTFTSLEIKSVFIDAQRFPWAESTISNDSNLKHIRSGERKGLIPDSDNEWLYEKVSSLFHSLNKSIVKQDWSGYIEVIQFSKYEVGDHYDIHFDGFEETQRKLSMSIQLSKPEDYEGGMLEIGLPNNPVTIATSLGTVACFPSWMPHAITPVAKGTRYSLVAWAHGPAVR